MLRPIQLFLDFDGTLTQKDTLNIVAQAGYDHQHETLSVGKHMRPWTDIVDAYIRDYSAHARLYNPDKNSRTSVQDELSWLDSLQEVETKSYNRVSSAGIFENVTDLDLKNAAAMALQRGELKFRPGWEGLILRTNDTNLRLGHVSGHSHSVSILSVNWSRSFICHALDQSSIWRDIFASDDSLSIGVYANEIPSVKKENKPNPHFNGTATELRTSGDKHMQMSNLRWDRNANQPLAVYVGDSATDLSCLLAADIGVCIRDDALSSGQKDLAETCSRLGIKVQDLRKLGSRDLQARFPLEDTGRPVCTEPRRLWYAGNFDDITLFFTNAGLFT